MMALYAGPGINPAHLLEYVIEPVLTALPIHSPLQTGALLLGTAWIESRCGQNLHQEPGPAASLYQIEPVTYKAIYQRLNTQRHSMLMVAVDALACQSLPDETQVHGNLYYATAIARCLYYFDPNPIPASLSDLYEYYLRVWRPGRPQPTSVFLSVARYVPGVL